MKESEESNTTDAAKTREEIDQKRRERLEKRERITPQVQMERDTKSKENGPNTKKQKNNS